MAHISHNLRAKRRPTIISSSGVAAAYFSPGDRTSGTACGVAWRRLAAAGCRRLRIFNGGAAAVAAGWAKWLKHLGAGPVAAKPRPAARK